MSAAYDEFWERERKPRAHQSKLFEALEAQTPDQREALQTLVRRRTVEQEVTFNILGSPDGTSRQWQLDWLPMVLSQREHAELERGLAQRAHLLEAVLRDLYGERRLLSDGLLPGRIIYGNPHYFRSVHGWPPHGGHRLVVYAADLGRCADGSFVVFSDRSASPTGAGYALENRLVVGRLLADLFRTYPVEKINRFFDTLGATLRSMAPPGTSDPRVVVLTPGLQDESSFEHAYLARYLGFQLVEGRDLTVRDDVVYLKTLAGLERVDVVLRRVFDDWCDPLLLRPESVLGVAGLVSAARSGNVALANPLGSAVVESPAFKAYLPRLCRALFDEELRLPSATTRWCGDPEMLAEVMATLDEWVIKPAFQERRELSVPVGQMAPDQRADILERLRQRPDQLVAERWPERSVVPVSGLGASGTLALRAFLCRDGLDFIAMPGGLARVDATPDGVFIVPGGEKLSKDVWVVGADSGVAPRLPAMPEASVVLRRGGVDLPSRLLDDIFWLGRYVERCDQGARLIRAGLERSTSEVGSDAELALPSVSDALRALEFAPKARKLATRPEDYLACLGQGGGPNNLRTTLDRIHGLTTAVRSRLSRDAWHVLRELPRLLPSEALGGSRLRPEEALDLLRSMITTTAAVRGFVADAMVRGYVWVFLDVGRRIERGVFTATLLRAFLPDGATRVHMEALLEVADSLLTYRSRYLTSLQAAPIVDLLLVDDTNPQSVLFQVDRLLEHASRLPRPAGTTMTGFQRKLVTLHASLATADVHRACADDGSALRSLLEDATNTLWQLSDELTRSHFSHAATSRAVAPPRWIDDDLEAT